MFRRWATQGDYISTLKNTNYYQTNMILMEFMVKSKYNLAAQEHLVSEEWRICDWKIYVFCFLYPCRLQNWVFVLSGHYSSCAIHVLVFSDAWSMTTSCFFLRLHVHGLAHISGICHSQTSRTLLQAYCLRQFCQIRTLKWAYTWTVVLITPFTAL